MNEARLAGLDDDLLLLGNLHTHPGELSRNFSSTDAHSQYLFQLDQGSFFTYILNGSMNHAYWHFDTTMMYKMVDCPVFREHKFTHIGDSSGMHGVCPGAAKQVWARHVTLTKGNVPPNY